MNDSTELLTVAEFAQTTRIGVSTAKAIIARDEIASITIGRRRLIPRAAVRAFIDSRLAAK